LATRNGCWLEERPRAARRAAGRLTCFGGGRWPGEAAERCLRRELGEELAWRPSRLGRAIDLWVASRWIARFQVVVPPPRLHCRIAGHRLRLVPMARLEHPRISRWHAAVLAAWRQGRQRVQLER
jgi:8-oxo-dGTP pyrophosphatase MutT (NUDIX family)